MRNYDETVANKAGMGLGEEEFLDKDIKDNLFKKNIDTRGYLSGIETLKAAGEIFSSKNIETKLIAAGIRNPFQFDEAVKNKGVSAVTMPYNVFLSILNNEGTENFIEKTYSNSLKIYEDFMKNG